MRTAKNTSTSISFAQAAKKVALVRGVDPVQRWPAVREAVRAQAGDARSRVVRRLVVGQVRGAQLIVGVQRANSYFWVAPFQDGRWFNVQRRLEYLARAHPAEVAAFVEQCANRVDDPVAVASMARHPLTFEILRRWMLTQSERPSAQFRHRLTKNLMLGGAYAGAARLLLDTDDAERLCAWIVAQYQMLDDRFFQWQDSVACTMVDSAPPRVAYDKVEPIGHRLIITESLADEDAIALLLPGAAKVTLMATADTYGASDLSAYRRWPHVGEVTAEHVRSRIARYSPEYHDLHETTAQVATDLARQLKHLPTVDDETQCDILAVEIADFIFFQALKVRALEKLLDDGQFDEIVLGLAGYPPEEEFVRLLAGVRGLADDPRVVITSISRSARGRSNFWALLDTLALADPFPTPTLSRTPERLVIERLEDDSLEAGRRIASRPSNVRPRVAIVTTNNPAYNDSTAGYINALCADFAVDVVHVGQNATGVLSSLRSLQGDNALEVPIEFISPSPSQVRALSSSILRTLEPHLPPIDPTDGDAARAAVWAARAIAPRMCAQTIAPALLRNKTFERWLTESEAAGHLPDAIIVTPQRNPLVGSIVPIARSHKVPTLALEPHAQDANYARYTKIATDYYGVMSDYFRTSASAGFAIPEDRVVVVGSPRQVAPPRYERAPAVAAARGRFEEHTGRALDAQTTYLTYFCQPSEWSHTARVWRNILEAAGRTESTVLLKLHPEDTASRRDAYLEVASACGQRARVVPITCDASTAIELADLVLTAYSAAGLDAACRQAPVICVTDGNVRYPVDLPAIIDAPLARSVEDLTALIEEFRTSPERFDERARALIQREPQFVTGPGPLVRELLSTVIERGEQGIRSENELPHSLFLDGPHPTFPV